MNSTNIKVISEEIQRLKDQVHAIDVEVPDPSEATDGQILSVDNGKYVISDPELPSYSVSDEGKYLGVDSSGDLEFSNPPGKYNLDYSTTETATGEKIDGKDVYRIMIKDSFPEITQGANQIVATVALNLENIHITSVLNRNDGYVLTNPFQRAYRPSTGQVILLNVTSTYSEQDYIILLEYTKKALTRDGDTEPETTSTKKKTTKKGE